jgi:hypothetical protein
MMKSNWTNGEKGHVAEHNEISKRLVNVLDFGVTKSTTPEQNSVYIQNAIDSMNGKGKLFFPEIGGYKVSATLQLLPKAGKDQTHISIEMDDDTGFVWKGDDNVPVIYSAGWKLGTISRVNITVNNGSTGVTAWEIDDPEQYPSSGNLTFINCTTVLNGSNCIGWRGGLNGITDVSFLNFINCSVKSDDNLSGNIGWYPYSANCLNWTWVGGWGLYLNTAIKSRNTGCMYFDGFGASHNLLDFEVGSGYWTIIGGRFEVGKAFIKSSGTLSDNGVFPVSVSVIGSWIADYTPADGILIGLFTTGQLMIDNCAIYNYFYPMQWTEYMITLGGGNAGYGSFCMKSGSVYTEADLFHVVSKGNWSVRVEDVTKLDIQRLTAGRFENIAS